MNIFRILIIVLLANVLTLNAQQVNQVNASGEKEGVWIKYFNNGKIKYEGQFRKDRPYGQFTYYFKKGNIKAVSLFSDDGIVAHTTTYYEGGKIMAEGKYVNQQKDSVWKYYLDEKSNPVVSMETYKNGILFGESITYYTDSGNPAEILMLENGKKNGKLLKYFPDGQLMTESYYKDGQPDGSFIHYHPNGKVQIQGVYYNGRQAGEWKYFDEDGNPVDKDEFMKQDEVEEIK